MLKVNRAFTKAIILAASSLIRRCPVLRAEVDTFIDRNHSRSTLPA
jgi:hypothetical protein